MERSENSEVKDHCLDERDAFELSPSLEAAIDELINCTDWSSHTALSQTLRGQSLTVPLSLSGNL